MRWQGVAVRWWCYDGGDTGRVAGMTCRRVEGAKHESDRCGVRMEAGRWCVCVKQGGEVGGHTSSRWRRCAAQS